MKQEGKLSAESEGMRQDRGAEKGTGKMEVGEAAKSWSAGGGRWDGSQRSLPWAWLQPPSEPKWKPVNTKRGRGK